ncbi:hypothetical protein BDY24DRAFT_72903 [Mrakia frigida]|uniref:uncharacterized protein n=1 Tax=Mrakia frigida TaxID=29902 RepID=UPI003FCC2216
MSERGSGSGFLSLLKRSSSGKKDKKDTYDGEGSGRSTPTTSTSPSIHISALPSDPPLLPPSLHASSPSSHASPRITNNSPPSPSSLPPLQSPLSSEPNYPESSTSTSEGRRRSFLEKSPSSLLVSLRRRSSGRQGKGAASVDNDDDHGDQQPQSPRSPEKQPPERPPRQRRPPSLDLSSSAFLLPTNTTSSPVPSQICLPPESPSEALGETEVIELQAFVDKKRWIEDRIEVLKSLPPIECFVVLMPTFSSRNREKEEEVMVGEERGKGALPTKEELDEMFAEQDRIEEEADRFDGGDLERLRKMAKAASQKSLSISDTHLLSITLSTLFLLDTLLHLLRARGETLDLLALRLQWDAMRFAVAKETEALERDVKKFVEGKGRWGVEKYEKSGLGGSGNGGMGSPVLVTMAWDRDGGGGHGRDGSDNGSIRSVGGSLKVASRSQRYLLTQILELDSQSFHNRISSLRSGPVLQTGKILDKMIDVAASVRSHQVKRRRMGSSTSAKSLDSTATVMESVEEKKEEEERDVEKEDDGAVPEWFLDEMDRVDERVNGLKEFEDLARGSVKQWKFADQTFHTTRKLLNSSTTLSYDLAQAFLQHPTVSRSRAFTAKASAIVSDLTLVPDPSSSSSNTFPRPTHSSLPSLPSANRTIASVLTEELSGAKDEARKAHRMAKEYEKLVERVDRLEGLKGEMGKLAGKLEEEAGKLENGLEGTTKGERVDLSSSDCLKSEEHSAYLAHFPIISASIASLEPSTSTTLRETAALLLALRSAGGVDPNLRSSVDATSNRLGEALRRALAARDASSVLVERLGTFRTMNEAQTTATNRSLELKSRIIAQIEETRWTGLDGTQITPSSISVRMEATTLLVEQISSLEFSFSKTVTLPLDELSSSLKNDHPQLISHLVESSSRIRDRLSSLRELARLLQAVNQQSTAMASVSSESEKHIQRTSDLETSIQAVVLAAKEGSEDTSESSTTDLRDQLTSQQSIIQTFVSSFSSLIPFVASPSSSAALLAHHLPSLNPSTNSLLTPPRSPAQPFFQADLLATEPSSSVDLLALDGLVRSDANLLAASLSGGIEHLGELFSSIEVARAGRKVEKAEEACERAMREWEEEKKKQEERLDSVLKSISPFSSSSLDLSEQESLLVELHQLQTQAADALPPFQLNSSNLLTSLETALSTLQATPHSSALDNLPERSTSLLRVQDTQSRLERVTKELLDKSGRSVADQQGRVEEEKAKLAAVAEEELRRKREAEEAEVARKLAVEEEGKRVAEEAAAAWRREEEEAKREEEEARLEREKEVKARLQREKDEREERQRLEDEAESKRLVEELESKRLADEAESRRVAEEHAEEERSRMVAEKIKKDLEEEANRVRRVEEEQRLADLSNPALVAEETSTPRSQTASAVPFPPSSNFADDDDVFGPTTGASTSTPRLPPSTSRNLLDRIHSLQTRIDVLDLTTAASIPSSSTITPGIHHLPTAKESRNAKQELDSVGVEVSSLPSSVGGDEKDALLALKASLLESRSLLIRMELLSTFAFSVLACDESFSHLLDRIDDAAPLSRPVTPASPNKSHSSLQDSLDSATSLFDRAILTSKTISPEDHRVAEEVRRITQAFEEMKEMAEEKMNPLSRLRERSVSVASSFDGSVDGSVVGEEGRRSRGSMTRSSSSASIASLTKTVHPSRIPKSVSTSHSLSSASTPTSLRSRLPTSSSRPRIPSMMFKPPSSVNTNGSPRSFSGPASSTPTASAPNSSIKTSTTTTTSSSKPHQAHYHAQTISSSSRERTLSTISSSSGSTQIPSTPVRTRLPSLLNGRVSSPSPFQNPAPAASTKISSVRSHSTLSRYKRPSTATGVPHSFAEESPDNRRHSTNFGTTPRRSISIRSRLDEVDGQMTPTKRTSLGGGVGTNVSPAPRKKYRAKKNDKLDRAVGRIVNALPVEIPIVPVVAGFDSESGKYWIGQPPKLCFCRILRSKTVMVRVGGGWVELSKFLRDHFGILLPATTSPIPATPQGSDRWIQGGTPLHTSTGASFVAPSTPGPSHAPHPPSTPNLTFPRNSQSPQLLYSTPGHAFPYRTRHSSLSPATPSFTSPILAQGAEAGSPGSPLVPLHIMRKAEEGAHSPPTISGTGGRKSIGLGISGGERRRPTGGGGGGEGSMGRSFSGGSVGGPRSSVPWRV